MSLSPALRRFVIVTGGLGLVALVLVFVRHPPVAARASEATDPLSAGAPRGSGDVANFRVALDEARQISDVGRRSVEFGRLLRLWLAHDAEAALNYVRQLPRRSAEFTAGVLLVLDRVAERDPDRALKLAAELVADRDQAIFYSALFARLAEENLPVAVGRLALVSAGVGREYALRALTDVWSRTDLPAALAWAQKLSDADRGFALEAVLVELAVSDPRQAIELAQTSLHGPARERLVFTALPKLAATDPSGAAAFVTLLPAGEAQTLAMVDMARAFAVRDVSAALAWARTLPGDVARTVAMKNVLAIWEQQDAEAAARYVAALPSGREQLAAAEQVANFLGARDPSRALAWAGSLTDRETRSAALASAADSWSQHDPAAATRWIAAQPPEALGALASPALNGALSYWILRDAAAARAWLATANLPAEVKARFAK